MALDQRPGEGRRAAAGRRGYASCELTGTVGSARRAHRAAGRRRRQPRHPAGLLPRRPRIGPRRSDRGRRRPARAAGVLGQRDDHQRPHPPLLAAELARRDQRRHPLRCRAACGSTSVTATMGGGRVQFGGRIGFDGYLLGELNVTARGEDMHLRVPEGMRSVVDVDLALRGTVKAPTLGGTVTVKSARWTRGASTRPADIFDLASRAAARGGRRAPVAEPPRCRCASTSRCSCRRRCASTTIWRGMVASADLTLRGTYDRPVMFGHAEIERGELTFEGKPLSGDAGHDRFHQSRRGSSRSSTSKPRPTSASPRQNYRVTVGVSRHHPEAACRRSPRIRRCRPPTSWRCCSATCGGPAGRRAAHAAEPDPAANRHPRRRAPRRRSPAPISPKSARWSSRRSASTPSS